MASNFHETLDEAMPEMPSDRSTGLVLAAALLIGGLVFRAQHDLILIATAFPAGLLAGLALLRPASLAPLTRAWFRLGLLLSAVVSPVVLLLLYALAIVPFGLAYQLRADPLRKRRRPNAETYWRPRASTAASGSMRDQF
jgi:hypothetical protein